MARVTKDSAVEKKLRAVEDELNSLRKGMKSLSKEMGRRPVRDEAVEELPPEPEPNLSRAPLGAPPSRPQSPVNAFTSSREAPVASAVNEPPASVEESSPRLRPKLPASSDRIHEGRFADYYMANSYRSPRPLRQELNVQRTRAVFTLMFAVGLLIWFIYRFGPQLHAFLSGKGAPIIPPS